jgi:hypothetical protein
MDAVEGLGVGSGEQPRGMQVPSDLHERQGTERTIIRAG